MGTKPKTRGAGLQSRSKRAGVPPCPPPARSARGRRGAFQALKAGSSPARATSGCSAVGSAPGLGPGGRPFDSAHPDHVGRRAAWWAAPL